MEFGYFTLSDNHYDNNPRDANQFVADITAEALYADQLGMHSAWIGEHHFNSLGVLSCPDLVLAYIAARTKHIRLAPAVTVTAAASSDPRRRAMGDARPALRRPRRFRRRPRLRPARIRALPCRLRGQPEHLRGRHGGRSRSSGPPRTASRITASTTSSTTCAITPKPVQQPLPAYVGSFSKPSIELAARLGCGLIVAPFAAAMSYGGLKQVADLYNETCAKHGTKPGRLMCSYFTHFADNKAQEDAAARAPDPLLQGMRDPGVARRSARPRRRAIAISSTWWSGCTRCSRRT